MEKYLIIIHTVLITSILFSNITLIAARKIKIPTSYLLTGKIGIAFFLTIDLLFYEKFGYGHRILHPIYLFAGFLTFPMLGAHALGLIRKKKIKAIKLIAYALFAIIILSHIVIKYMKNTAPIFISFSQIKDHMINPELWMRFAAVFLFIIEWLFFTVYIIQAPKKYKCQNTRKQNKWICWNIYTTLTYGVLVILMIFSSQIIVKMCCAIIYTIETGITTFWILRDKNVLTEEELKPNNEKYNHDENSPHAKQEIKQQLIHLLNEKEIFTDPDLNREKVREMLKTNRTYLSEMINNEFNMSFPNLISSYRFKKAMEMLQSPACRNMSMKMIILMCGFKNQSQFCTLFKKKYGKTPGQWRKHANNKRGKINNIT